MSEDPELALMISGLDTGNIILDETIIRDIGNFNSSGDMISTEEITMEEIMRGLAMLEEINTTRSDTVQGMIDTLREMLEDEDPTENISTI